MNTQLWRWGKFSSLREVIPYGKTKIQKLVASGTWQAALPYVTDDAGDRLYNLTLIADWIANLHDPTAHHRACELYLASLPSNHPKAKAWKG
jgi:hypothetical protein